MSIRSKKLMTENEGSTLIEVIVSCLIMAIVFVPLLTGMNTALKANKVSESKMYADNVASKCMEVIKASATKSAVQQCFTDAGINATNVTPTTSGYTISGLKEGDRTYVATITYDATGAINDASKYKSIGSVAGNRKARLELGVNYDFAALKLFSENLKSGSAKPIEMVKYLKEKNVKLTVSKVTNTSDEHFGMYSIAPEIEYVMNNTENGVEIFKIDDTYTLCPTVMYYSSLPEGILLFETPVTSIGGVNNSSTAISEALYNYCKAKDNTLGDQSSYNVVNANLAQTITINNQITDLEGSTKTNGTCLNVYCFISGADITKAYNNAEPAKSPAGTYSSKMKLKVINKSTNSDTMKVYCPLQITPMTGGEGTYGTIGTLLKTATSDEISKIYKVKIEVKNTATSAVEATLESTVICKD